MTTVQLARRTRDELMARKRASDAPSVDAVVWELLHPRPRKGAVVQAVQRLGPALQQMGAQRVHLFGSVVRDEAHAGSDVDLIVDLAPGRDYFDLARIQALTESALRAPSDVVPPGGLHPRLAPAIWAEAEEIWHA